MNFTPVTGWFYKTANDRTASWTGVEYFFRFLTENEGTGPFGEEAPLDELEIGDFVQLGSETGDFYHTPFVCGFSRGKILVAAHTFDAYNRPLSSYSYQRYGAYIFSASDAADFSYNRKRNSASCGIPFFHFFV